MAKSSLILNIEVQRRKIITKIDKRLDLIEDRTESILIILGFILCINVSMFVWILQ